MKRNMGHIDRAVRGLLVAPAAIVAAVLLGPATAAGIVLFVVAAVMAGTASLGYCPLYSLLHVSTCPRGAARA